PHQRSFPTRRSSDLIRFLQVLLQEPVIPAPLHDAGDSRSDQLNWISALRTACTNASILSADLIPGASSIPLLTSTANGRRRRMLSPTLASDSPPAKTMGRASFALRTAPSRDRSKPSPLPP